MTQGPARRRRGAGRRFLVVGDVLDGVIATTATAAFGRDDPDATIRARPDGTGANTAAWLGWLGSRVDFVGRVGIEDVYRHGAALADAGVTPHLAYDRATGTGVVVSVHTPQGDVAMVDAGASARLDLDDVEEDLIDQADVVHLAGDGLFAAPDAPEHLAAFVARAERGGARTSVRPPSRDRIAAIGRDRFLAAIEGVDLLVTGLAEGQTLTGSEDPIEVGTALAARSPLVVVTLGPGGVLVARPGRTPQRVPAPDVTVVDTIGVGDAFAAGFLCAWATDPVRFGAAAREGLRVAARSLTVVGARPPV